MPDDQSVRNRLLRESILKLPAQPPPPGVIPNFEHPSTSIYGTVTTTIMVGIVFSTLLVAAKMYNQIWIYRKVHVEDWCLVIAWAIYTFAGLPMFFLIRELPVGIHQWETHVGPFIQHMFYWYCTFAIYALIMAFLKIAIMLEILRVFVPARVRNGTYWATQINLWVNTIFNILLIFLVMFSCTPRARFWDPTVKGRCLDYRSLILAGSVICLVTDLVILFLPQRIIYGLKLKMSRKIGLSLIFAIGILACTASAVRTYYHYVLWRQHSDYTYILARSGLWGMIQLTAGFLCAGLPAMPKFISMLRTTPSGSRVETGLRSLLRISGNKVSHGSPKGASVGSGKKKMVTDIEFQELVGETDGTDTTIGVDSVMDIPKPAYVGRRT